MAHKSLRLQWRRQRLIWDTIALPLLLALLLPIAAGLDVIELGGPVRIGLLSCFLVAVGAWGVSVVAILGRVGRAPLMAVPPLNAESDEPLSEIQCLAARAAARLRSSYRTQLVITIGMIILLFGIMVWSIVMVTLGRLEYAAVLGSGGICAAVLTVKWQPFDRVGRARDLAEQADALATGLRMRLATIGKIPDPVSRQEAEWKAVKDYTEETTRQRQVEWGSREAA